MNILDPKFEKFQIFDSYACWKEKGTQQSVKRAFYLTNFYLGFVDRYIKETLRIKGYVRYMDDMVIFGNNRYIWAECASKIIHFIQERLFLKVKPAYGNKCVAGVPFLGYLMKPAGIFLSQKSKTRFIRRYKSYLHFYNEKRWDITALSEHVTAIIAWTLIAKSEVFRYTVFQRYGL